MRRIECLSPAELAAFHSGDVPEADLAELADHLGTVRLWEVATGRTVAVLPQPYKTRLASDLQHRWAVCRLRGIIPTPRSVALSAPTLAEARIAQRQTCQDRRSRWARAA